MEPSDALRVFGTENYSPFVQRGIFHLTVILEEKYFNMLISINTFIIYHMWCEHKFRNYLTFLSNLKYSPFPCIFIGAVIGLEFNGEGCIELVRSALNAFQQEQICDYFCSESRSGAEKQIEDFYNYADMQMAVWCCPNILIQDFWIQDLSVVVIIDSLYFANCKKKKY